jgi:hypothetical protein
MTHPRITNTSTVAAKHIKVLVHGPSGAGKTRLCATTGGKPLIISAESGLLSLREFNLDVWTVASLDDIKEVYKYLLTDIVYDWVCLDSISEIAEVVLADEKKLTKDGRAVYGNMAEKMASLIRDFRDLPKNVYMAAKQGKTKDEITGGVIFGPSAPGQVISQALPYFFDEVFALHRWKDNDGKFHTALQTGRDAQYEAKDRSGALAPAEPADLGAIHVKILSTVTNQE